MSSQEFPDNPFGNIALALSGGGFRAASFSLGAMSYLRYIQSSLGSESEEEHPLLDNVRFISSASGGTFTNALYSAYIHNGKSFEDCYKKLIEEMQGEDIVNQALTILNNDSEWNQPGNGKRRNIINAFAKVYNQRIFEDETFGVYWNKNFVKQFEVCFNATEFYRGLSFRFQTNGKNEPRFDPTEYKDPLSMAGNTYMYFTPPKYHTLKKIRLADMMAASSCFPMGFEPIVYPEDFTYNKNGNELSEEELYAAVIIENYKEKKEILGKPVGLMDGGITDNQGLYSAMTADKLKRSRGEDPFDLIIVTDVASYFMDPYVVPKEKKEPAWRENNILSYINKLKRLSSLLNISSLVFALLLLVCTGLLVFTGNETLHAISWVTGGISLALLGITLLIIRLKNKYLPKALDEPGNADINQYISLELGLQHSFTNSIINKLIHYMGYTRLGVLEQMLKARLSSVITMVSDVNLKQIRRLIFKMFYENPIWNNRRVPNFIYEFSLFNVEARLHRLSSPSRLGWKTTEEDRMILLTNCQNINAVAEDARTMGTTLWFDQSDLKDNRLKKLLATGAFTTCGNLLEYVISLRRKGAKYEPEIQEKLDVLEKKLKADWSRFKGNPYFVTDEFEKKTQLKKPGKTK